MIAVVQAGLGDTPTVAGPERPHIVRSITYITWMSGRPLIGIMCGRVLLTVRRPDCGTLTGSRRLDADAGGEVLAIP